ncbi:MAG: hypothetical protein EOO62_40335, partial [Hymenobacter sp.]
MTPAQFEDKWAKQEFIKPNYGKIDETYLQRFVADIAETFGVDVLSVAAYVPGKKYAKEDLVRYTPGSGQEAFYYALKDGNLPAPVAVGDTNWKVVPGPVPATLIGQEITLAQARSMNGDLVVLGRDYAILWPTSSASGHQQVVVVAGIAENWFASEGWLVVNNVRSRIEQIDFAAGTWELSNSSPILLYEPGQLTQGFGVHDFEAVLTNAANLSFVRLNARQVLLKAFAASPALDVYGQGAYL